MALVETTISASVYDYIQSYGAVNSYPDALDGVGTLLTGSNTIFIGQSWNYIARVYSVYQSYLRFDTSTIPDNAVIKDVRLEILYGSDATVDFFIEARSYDFGATVTTADFVPQTSIAAKPLLGIADTSSMSATQYYPFIGNQAFIDAINLTGFTGILLNADRNRRGDKPSAPSGADTDELFGFTGARLVVTYEDTVVSEVLGTRKKYEYKIYDKDGNFLETMTDVTSEFGYKQELNSAGSDAVITLGREAGDFTNIDVGYKVEVYVFDRQAPNGQLLYTGKITRYSDKHADDENVTIVLQSYGTEFSHYVLEAITGATSDISQTTQNTTYDLGITDGTWIAQSFQPTATPLAQLGLNFGRCINTSVIAICEDDAGTPGTILSQVNYGSGAAGVNNISISPAVDVVAGRTYWILIKSTDLGKPVPSLSSTLLYQNTSVYSGGKLIQSTNSGATWSDVGTSDLYFVTYSGSYSTTITYTDKDPAWIMKDIMDKYIAAGGTIGYYYSQIEPTDTRVTYTFKNATILDAINTVTNYCPYRWFWYLDQALNKVSLRKRPLDRDVTLTFGKDIESMEPVRILDNVTNAVYFTGGEVSAGVNYYEKFVNQSSINFYGGMRAKPLTDNRVTLSGTAEKYANRVLQANIAPELRTTIVVTDQHPTLNDTGFDIETLLPGMVTGFGNVAGVPPLWDKAKWDEAYWDYNLKQLGSINMHIVSVDYHPGYATLELSSIPQDVVKLIDEALREVEKIQTLSNPSVPS